VRQVPDSDAGRAQKLGHRSIDRAGSAQCAGSATVGGDAGDGRMRVLLIQIDGALPNLALMKIAHWHKARGDEVTLRRTIEPQLGDEPFDKVYGSAIFKFSQERLNRFQRAYPEAIIGGTGTASTQTVEELLGLSEYESYDYSGYPEFKDSIGFTQRGCRLKCKFCVVPTKEGKNRSLNPIGKIWRGSPYPKHLNILDNDFFGQPEWRERISEIRAGGFKICLQQGINVRLLDDAAASALKTIEYRDTKFKERRLYTAWDNLKDENIFFRGVETLERAGIPAKHLRAYMLIGYDKNETWDRLWHRFNRMVERGIEPYPMVFDRSRKDLTKFQRWVITGLYRAVPFNEYDANMKGSAADKREAIERQGQLAYA
jgi:hypothetical protein